MTAALAIFAVYAFLVSLVLFLSSRAPRSRNLRGDEHE